MQTMQTKPRYQTARVRLHCTPPWIKIWDQVDRTEPSMPLFMPECMAKYPSLYSRPHDPVLRYPGKIIYSIPILCPNVKT